MLNHWALQTWGTALAGPSLTPREVCPEAAGAGTFSLLPFRFL